MKKISTSQWVALGAGGIAAATTFILAASAQGADTPVKTSTNTETAVFAGGCFWCVESDFDKVDGVLATVSGYAGGDVDNPTYKQVTYGNTGHLESVQVTYDPAKVSYEDLVDHFFRTIDPTDPAGQFCDKGPSYRTAVFVKSDEQKQIVEQEIEDIDASGALPKPVVTMVLQADKFWPAEDYHQNYYKTTPVRYRHYRVGCGRDAKLESLWGDEAITH